jgi:hypothetical protein
MNTRTRRAATLTVLLVVALLVVALVAACASRDAGSGADGQPGYATLVIENDNTSTVTVYALRAGTRQRLGSIIGLSRETFTIRRTNLDPGGELRVLVDPLGSFRTFVSHPVQVAEGDVIEMRVNSFLR